MVGKNDTPSTATKVKPSLQVLLMSKNESDNKISDGQNTFTTTSTKDNSNGFTNDKETSDNAYSPS